MYARKVFFIIKLALVLVLAYVTARTVMTAPHSGEIFVPTPAGGSENTTWLQAAHQSDTSLEDYSAIIERNMFFGATPSSNADGYLPGYNADTLVLSAEEELGLALLGAVAGSPRLSRAIIKDLESDVLGVYKTGDTIAAAHIECIEKYGVILLHQGQRKRLNLGTRGHKQHRTDSTQEASPKNIAQPTSAVKTNLPVDSHTTIATKLKNIETVLKNAVNNPYAVDGQMEGLRITGLEKIEGATNLGLKNGDVIRAVNGHRLTSKEKTYQVFKKARTQPMMDIELLRDNEIKTLSFSLR